MKFRSRARNGRALRLFVAVVTLLIWSGMHRNDAVALQQNASPNNQTFVPERILVKFRSGVSSARIDAVLAEVRGVAEGEIPAIGVHILKLPAGTAADAVALAMSSRPEVEFAEPDRMLPPSRIPNDPYYPSQWHLPKIQAPAAWDSTIGNSGLIVAILDTGVDSTHPDLAAKMIPGWNFYNNNSVTADVYGHGTTVAGAMAAAGDNWNGVSSVVWNSLIMPIRISDGSGWATYSAAANGLTWAADHGARVANISYAFTTSSTVASAAQYFQSRARGVVTVSAGNAATFDSSPDNPYILTVSATDSSDYLTSWSNTGNNIDVSAPGVSIYTTANGGGYTYASGTSYSAPIVAGVAGLALAANPNLTGAELRDVIKNSADDRGSAGWDPSYGAGRVNAAKAVALALNSTSSSDTTPPNVSITSPSSGATIAGSITVQVSASDNVSVSSVTLSVDGVSAGTDTSSPYAFPLDTMALTNTTHVLQATATDAAGNTASASVTVTVSNVADNIPPVPTISSPQNGATVSGNISIVASATDNIAVVKIDLYIDGGLKVSSKSSSLSTKWNTRNVQAGPHQILVKAYDPAGNEAVTSITVYR